MGGTGSRWRTARTAAVDRWAGRPTHRVLVTGSRDWTDVGMLALALEAILERVEDDKKRLLVVHGDCPSGADAQAELWVRQQRNAGRPVDSERHPANWRLYGDQAGTARNTTMANAGADLVLAFYAPGAANKGTADCHRKAVARGLTVTRYPPDEQQTLF